MQFKLSKFIVPSVISMVIMGTYTNIDGFFIGNAAGDNGLAAINIVWPIVAFITSLGCGIGIGGSVIMNNLRGNSDSEAAEGVKKSIILLLIISGLAVSVLSSLIFAPLLRIMGAEGEVYRHAHEYAVVVCAGAVFQIMGTGLLALLRNEHKTYQSMIYSIVGLVLHIILDWMLVGEYGLLGVGISTVASQLAIAVLCLLSLRIERNAAVSGIAEILKASTAPFGVNFVSSVVLLFTNYFALKAGGAAAVSAYAVMSYAVYTFDYIFQGVCDGIQPMISYCSGRGDVIGEKRAMKVSALVLAVCVICFVSLTPVLIMVMPKLFSVSEDAKNMMYYGFIIYAFSYPCKAAVKYICSYYYASKRFKLSNLLIYIDPLFITPMLLFVLSNQFAINGIWLAMTLAQLAVAAIGIISFVRIKIMKKKGDAI